MQKRIPSPQNPRFGIIAPTEYLDTYARFSDFHLTLAHLVDTDEKYVEFYKSASEDGDFIIMDNGAFELGESYNPDKLIELATKIKADAIVLPDYPGQNYQKTIDAAERILPQVKAAGFKTFFCPQSRRGDLNGWIESYRWASWNDDIDIIGMSILGIPNALPHIPKQYARVVMTQLLFDRGIFNSDKYHHYLGLNAGPALELPPLIELGAISSIDSSNPVWMGILGHQYNTNCDSYLPVTKVKTEVQFDYKMTDDLQTHDRIQNNISLTLSLIDSLLSSKAGI